MPLEYGKKINSDTPFQTFHSQPNFDLWIDMKQAKSFFGQEKNRQITIKVVKSHSDIQKIQDKWEKFYRLGNQVVDNAA